MPDPSRGFVDVGKTKGGAGGCEAWVGLRLRRGQGNTPTVLSLAAGEVSEEGLTRWIRDNWPAEPRK